MCTRWDFTVAWLRNSRLLICRFDRPSPTSWSTSSSRRVRASAGVRIRSISRWATEGASAERPAAAVRTAAASSCGGASLSR
ncbi:hypothetical protein SBADM41S_08202 [Streptomyces badius]